MASLATIQVNGVEITPHQINAEMQYHPADSLSEAQYEAARALVVKELLCQRATELGLCGEDECLANPDAIIDELLQRELDSQTPTEEEIRRFYDNNRMRFFSSTVLDASHILYLAPPEDEAAREEARSRAAADLQAIRNGVASFEELARAHSACPSAEQGGLLGPVARGQTVPGFEQALMAMRPGEMSPEPVASEVGYHLIRAHRREEGEQLAFDEVRDRIARLLTEQRWRQAFSQYVQLLAGQASITGFSLNAAETPLVQ